MGPNLGHGFRGGAGRLHGSHGVTKAGEWVLKVFWLYSKREKQWTGSVSAACFPQAGIARPLPLELSGRRRSWRRIRWFTESPRQNPGARAGPLRGRHTYFRQQQNEHSKYGRFRSLASQSVRTPTATPTRRIPAAYLGRVARGGACFGPWMASQALLRTAQSS